MADLPIPGLETARPGQSRIFGAATLDGVPIRVLLSMNSRSFLWRITVRDTVGSSMILGHTLTALADVFKPYRSHHGSDLPPGALFAYPVAGNGSSPRGFTAWSSTHKLVYRTDE